MKSQVYSMSSSSSSASSSSVACGGQAVLATKRFVFILNAFVNGFAQLKLCADRTDFEYIVEIYWSNDTRSFVKRTYDDFAMFHSNLCHQFSELSKCKSVMPALPPSKKRFWISSLKQAELREIELNKYVQRILKLPTHITHSQIVMQFFESHTGDPKPPATSETGTEFGSESFDAEDTNLDHEYIESYLKQSSDSASDIYEDDLEEKKLEAKQANLWWDEDNALNELTTSTSFELGSQFNLNQLGSFYSEQHDDVDTLRTLESILKTSDLFSTNSHSDPLVSSHSSFKYRNRPQLNLDLTKRLSLS
ncbi:neutrophil cytosol factor 1 [Brachionus plicatilis]|uniref:Neutrophil cytosol factor 1 n=1 Tax=Brachionus plicatilis TaxID=10195 RepID=A0A3M7TAM6_BRAPC|nr:neutrophil cytosol factor 1 [Brachionus plicatilis]